MSTLDSENEKIYEAFTQGKAKDLENLVKTEPLDQSKETEEFIKTIDAKAKKQNDQVILDLLQE